MLTLNLTITGINKKKVLKALGEARAAYRTATTENVAVSKEDARVLKRGKKVRSNYNLNVVGDAPVAETVAAPSVPKSTETVASTPAVIPV